MVLVSSSGNVSERNLAPAEFPKQAATFDLPITLGILAGNGQFESDRLAQYAVVGELALDGATRSTKGVLSMAAARELGVRGLLVPNANAAETAVVQDIDIIAVASLAQAVAFLAVNTSTRPSTIGCWIGICGSSVVAKRHVLRGRTKVCRQDSHIVHKGAAVDDPFGEIIVAMVLE